MKTKKEMPYDFWNHNIHPILGYKWKRPTLKSIPPQNKNEYPPEDDYKVDDGVIAYFTRQTRSKTDNNNEQ